MLYGPYLMRIFLVLTLARRVHVGPVGNNCGLLDMASVVRKQICSEKGMINQAQAPCSALGARVVVTPP